MMKLIADHNHHIEWNNSVRDWWNTTAKFVWTDRSRHISRATAGQAVNGELAATSVNWRVHRLKTAGLL